jgi:hypothetical protein
MGWVVEGRLDFGFSLVETCLETNHLTQAPVLSPPLLTAFLFSSPVGWIEAVWRNPNN